MASQNPKIQIGVEVDASQAKQGLDTVKNAIDQTKQSLDAQAASVKRSSEELDKRAQVAGRSTRAQAQAERKAAEDAERAAKAQERATSRIIKQVELSTAALQAGGRTNSQFFETIAKQSGADPAKLAPYIAQLKAAEAAQANLTGKTVQAGKQLDQYGNTAKQTAAALRQVPAQLTDIVVSLQGGQAPLTVLLQQGGQLRDIFGGIRPAVTALARTLLSLVTPVTAIAAAVGVLSFGFISGRKELENFNKTLILTGNTLGLTGPQLQDIATSVSQATSGITKSRAAEVLNELAASGKVGAQNLEQLTRAAILFEQAGGEAAEETAKKFQDLAKSPTEAVIKLNQATNFLTREIFDQIRALEEQGRATDAAALAQRAYADAIENRTPRLVENLGFIERAWVAIARVGRLAIDQIKEVGRSNPLAEIDAQLQFAINSGASEVEISALEARRNALLGVAQAQAQAAKEEAEANKRTRAGIELSDAAENADSKLANQRKRVAEATSLFAQATAGLAKDSAEYRKAETDYLRLVSEIVKVTEPKKRDTGRQDALAGLRLDIEKIKSEGVAAVDAFTNATQIFESLRSAGLVADREYFSEKSRLLREVANAEIASIDAQNARLRAQRLNTKDGLDRDRQVAENETRIAKLRSDLSKNLILIGLDEVKINRAKEASLQQLILAEQSYITTQERARAAQLQGFGLGNQGRSLAAGVNQINDRFSQQRAELEGQRQLDLIRGGGTLTEDQSKFYDERLALIAKFQNESLLSYQNYYTRLKEQEADWSNGLSESLNNYIADANNISKQIEDAFTSAFKGMEDALVTFITTGKLNFNDLANSIVADITRIIVKQQIIAPLLSGFGLNSPGPNFVGPPAPTSNIGSAISSFFGNLFGGFRASGGPVSSGMLYQVNEQGPELLNVAGKQYLMMGSQGGTVTPNSGISKSQNININVQMPPNASRETGLQFGRMIAQQLSVASARNG